MKSASIGWQYDQNFNDHLSVFVQPCPCIRYSISNHDMELESLVVSDDNLVNG